MEFLKTLGLKAENLGTSTGSDWMGDLNTSNLIRSYSPVDGKYIGSVVGTTAEEYEHVIYICF